MRWVLGIWGWWAHICIAVHVEYAYTHIAGIVLPRARIVVLPVGLACG